jgi:hypothetical protein
MNKRITILICASLTVLFFSCKDQYDFDTDKISTKINLQAGLAVPLVNASVTLEQVLSVFDSTSFIELDENKYITVVLERELKQISANEFFEGIYSGTLNEISYNMPVQIFKVGTKKIADYNEVYVADPRITVKIVNYWNIPVRFKITSFYYYETALSPGIPGTGSFFENWHTIVPPLAPALSATTELKINNSNSNIADIVSSTPNHISIGATIETIPGGTYSVPPGSVDSVSLKLEVPTELRIRNLILRDTVNFDAAKELGEDTSKIESVKLNLVFDNGFPIDVNAQLIFLDDSNTILDSISTTGIEIVSAQVTGGKVSKSAIQTQEINLDGGNKNAFFKSSKIVVRVRFNTTNSMSGQTIKLYSDYKFGVKAGALAKIKL